MSGFQDLSIIPLVQTYGIDNFVETGCYTGDGIRHAIKSGIRNIYSCDINPTYVKICIQQFPNAIISTAHSVDFLQDIVNYIPGRCLFWLDAHFPELYGQQSKSKEEYFPLIEELKIISKKDGVENDVIIVDDIRVFMSEDNPIKQEFDAQYKIYGHTIKELVSMFPLHNNELVSFQEGILYFLPKI